MLICFHSLTLLLLIKHFGTRSVDVQQIIASFRLGRETGLFNICTCYFILGLQYSGVKCITFILKAHAYIKTVTVKRVLEYCNKCTCSLLHSTSDFNGFQQILSLNKNPFKQLHLIRLRFSTARSLQNKSPDSLSLNLFKILQLQKELLQCLEPKVIWVLMHDLLRRGTEDAQACMT